MLTAFPSGQPPGPGDMAGTAWLDLLGPDPEAVAQAAALSGLALPSAQQIAEIETSSRLAESQGVLTLTTPLLTETADGDLTLTPFGLVLAENRLVTLRSARHAGLEAAGARLPPDERRGAEAFLLLMETLVDGLADRLESNSAALDRVNARLFARRSRQKARASHRDASLRVTLREVGRDGDAVSRLRDALLGHDRILRFARETALFLTDAERRRIKTLLADIASLNDYANQLQGRVQMMLDATLGFINIEQNDTVRLLTVVSVVGIPPVLLAGIWGMNFEHMPELHLPYGYPMALASIAISTVLPIIWLRLRGML